MKLILFLLTLIISFSTFSRSKIPTDNFTIGLQNTSAEKRYIFNTGDGDNNRSLSMEALSKLLKFDGNDFRLGDGSPGNKTYIFNNADTVNPSLSVDYNGSDLIYNKPFIQIGDGTNQNSGIKIDIGQGVNNPSIEWDSATNSLKQRVNNTLKGLGGGGPGGGGGINAFGEDNNADAESGTTGWTDSGSSFTTEAISGVQAYGEAVFSFTGAAQNEKVTSTSFDFTSQAYGRNCEAGFIYKTDSSDYELHVTDGNGDILNLPGDRKIFASSTYVPFAVTFLCPSTSAITADTNKKDIKLELVNIATGATTKINWDFVYLGSNRNVRKSTLPNTFAVNLNSIPSTLEIGGAEPFPCTTTSQVDHRDYDCDISSLGLTSRPVCVANRDDAGSAYVAYALNQSSSTSLNFRSQLTTGNTPIVSAFSFICMKTGTDYDKTIDVFQATPITADVTNSFNAIILNSGSIFSQSPSNFISGVTKTQTGIYQIDLIPGTFSELPVVTTTIMDGSGNCRLNRNFNVTNNQFFVSTFAQNGNLTDCSFHLKVEKSGSDISIPQTKNISLDGMFKDVAIVPGSGIGKSRICAWRGTTNSTSLAEEFGSCVSSVVNGATGQASPQFEPNYWANRPICTCSVVAQTPGTRVCNSDTTTSRVDVATSAVNTATNFTYYMVCVGDTL